MSLPIGFASGLNFLPNWLHETKDPNAWERLLSEWVRASCWRTAGVVWPIESPPTLAQLARTERTEVLSALPAELPDMSRALKSGNATVVWQLPGSAGRLYTLFQPSGRNQGLIWAERSNTEPWTEADRAYLTLSARMIERAPALAIKIGPMLEPERLVQRLADAAIIAGRMGHDFNNVLTGIMGFADLSLPLVNGIPQAAKFVSEIAKVGQRGILFTQILHQLSRSGQTQPQPGSVAIALAKEEARLRTHPAAANVQIIGNIPNNLLPVAIDNAPLGIILGHVLENAIEASPPGGRVLVSTKVIEITPAEARSYIGNATPGANVEVSVQDQGAGIKPEVRAKLFAEPFYTTKVRHRGLGLAIVLRTLHAHGGAIRLDSNPAPDSGTIVRLILPPTAHRPTSVSRPTHATTTFGG